MAMRKYVLLVSFLLIIIVGLEGCSYNKETNDEQNAVNTIGNTSNNMILGGHVARQGSWIYYYRTGGSLGIGEGLYKSKLDGNQEHRIISGNISNINVLGDWIYYVLAEKNRINGVAVNKYNLYKMKSDGSSQSLVLTDCYYINIINDAIYYMKYIDDMGYRKAGIKDYPLINDNGKIYRSIIDGTQPKVLVNIKARKFVVSGDNIYYYDDTGIYKTSIDGLNTKKVISDEVIGFTLKDNKIFYTIWNIPNNESTIKIFDLASEKTEILRFSGKQVSTITPYSDSILFRTADFKVYKIKQNGEEEEELTEARGLFEFYVFDKDIIGWQGRRVSTIMN